MLEAELLPDLAKDKAEADGGDNVQSGGSEPEPGEGGNWLQNVPEDIYDRGQQ